jgi:hypothetical protein
MLRQTDERLVSAAGWINWRKEAGRAVNGWRMACQPLGLAKCCPDYDVQGRSTSEADRSADDFFAIIETQMLDIQP